jgi:hypothetical protein
MGVSEHNISLFILFYFGCLLTTCILCLKLHLKKKRKFWSLLNYSHIEVPSGAAHDGIEKEEIKHKKFMYLCVLVCGEWWVWVWVWWCLIACSLALSECQLDELWPCKNPYQKGTNDTQPIWNTTNPSMLKTKTKALVSLHHLSLGSLQRMEIL